jgi:hypothetical protein
VTQIEKDSLTRQLQNVVNSFNVNNYDELTTKSKLEKLEGLVKEYITDCVGNNNILNRCGLHCRKFAAEINWTPIQPPQPDVAKEIYKKYCEQSTWNPYDAIIFAVAELAKREKNA